MSQQLLKVRIITKITKYDPLQNTKNSKNMTLLLFFGQSTCSARFFMWKQVCEEIFILEKLDCSKPTFSFIHTIISSIACNELMLEQNGKMKTCF